jgi:hypothetical protein
MGSVPLLLEPLLKKEEWELFESQLKPTQQAYLLERPLFLQAVDSLGRIPRYIDFFLMRLKDTEAKVDLSDFLRCVLSRVVDNIKDAYEVSAWEYFLGKSPVGVRTMVLWAMCGKQVSLDDKLNGITVREARSSGILTLEEVEESPTLYTINVPLVLLRALNKTLRDVPDEYLDPVHIFDDREFEKAMCGLRILRQNLLVGMGKKTATYRELYPYAIGYKKDLDREIEIRKLEAVWTDGNPAINATKVSPLTSIINSAQGRLSYCQRTDGIFQRRPYCTPTTRYRRNPIQVL